MNAPGRSLLSFSAIASTLRSHFYLWMLPTIICSVLAFCYAVVRPNKWKAVVRVQVRQDSIEEQNKQSSYGLPEEIKKFQETVVQTLRSSRVVEPALTELAEHFEELTEGYPDKGAIENGIGRVTAAPPKSSEFGKIEYIDITAEEKTPERAEKFAELVLKYLNRELQQIRMIKAKANIIEQEQSLKIAQEDLSRATAKLTTVEKEVGRDLGELRTMTEGASGNSNLRESSNHIKQEIRNLQSKFEEYDQLKQLLSSARQDTNRIIEAPTRLFELQPALKRMREGLVDAQIKAANLLGKMTESHPEVLAARLAEQQVKIELATELDNLIKGLESDKIVSQNQLNLLQQQLADNDKRLSGLANIRTDYNNVFVEVKSCNDKLSEIQKRLGQARAIAAAASKTDLLIKVDEADAGTSPAGPSTKLILAGGLGGGLMLGLGLVFVSVPIGQMWGRRRTDHQQQGRRNADQLAAITATNSGSGRRSTDPVAPTRRAADRPASRRADDINNGKRISDQIRETVEVDAE
jgi:polysaccharide biosynthesis transport protein